MPAPTRDTRRRGNTRLQTMRMARTMTQRQLATVVGIRQQTLARYETGEVIPPPDRRAQLATILGTTSEVLWPPATVRRHAASA